MLKRVVLVEIRQTKASDERVECRTGSQRADDGGEFRAEIEYSANDIDEKWYCQVSAIMRKDVMVCEVVESRTRIFLVTWPWRSPSLESR